MKVRDSNPSKRNPLLSLFAFFGLGSRPKLEKKLKYAEEICIRGILGKELVNATTNILKLVWSSFFYPS